jgi:mono/diheme cytochrome c family protein
VQRQKAGICFFFGGLAALAVVAALGLLFMRSGIYDVAASKPHDRLVAWITHRTMIHSVRRHASGIAAPAAFRPEQLVAGFCDYDRHCVACHGGPAVGRRIWANGMTPGPPYLIEASREWTRSELFWITRHGLKMTAMPAWQLTLSDRQIWNVVAFLEALPHLPPQTYGRWRADGRCGSPAHAPD